MFVYTSNNQQVIDNNSYKQCIVYFVQMTNGGANLTQSALKRHTLESNLITSNANGMGNSPGLTSSSSSSPNAFSAALCGYNNGTLPLLTSPHHQTLPQAPTYYQQGMLVLKTLLMKFNTKLT